MRYEDTSGTFSAAGTPDARDDADLLPSGSHAPATGNVISGAGTTTGEAGADNPGNGLVVALRGAGGTDTSDTGTSLHVAGRYGTLTMDEHGNYKYVPEPRAPQGVRDVFNYTLETKDGRDTAELVINLGDRITVSENAQRIVPGPDGVVNLPPGVNLSDVHVVGRDLVVTLPDGSQIVIVDGAVFVPQLVLGGVEVPSTNLASLLIENEQILNPAGGTPQSSGGNFDVPVPPLDPGTPLGDLIPPTELIFGQPRFEEIGQFIDREPEAGTASAQLDDDAQQGGNPGGIGDVEPTNSSVSGSLPGDGGDGSLEWALLASGTLPAGFTFSPQPNGDMWILQGGVHVLTVSVNEDTGAYTVTQIAAIDHPAGGDENDLSFIVNYSVTDDDGDTAIGSLTINVDDDTPTVNVTAGSDANVNLTTHDHLTIGAGQESVSTTADFNNVFGATSFSPGADGAGPGTTSGYALSTTGGASGLFSHGVAINLYNVGGVIVGSTAASAAGIDANNTIFTVSTTNTGIVTLTQFAQIDHTNTDPTPTGPGFDDHSISLADGAITLTRSLTVVDGDGDSVTGSAAVQIGANLHFLDDGPTISLADRGEPSLTVDETDLGTNATASFAANFSASFGADGPAANSITYALGITGGNGVASGLIDVATGQSIVLVNNAGVIEGHVGSAAGALAFTVSVNASGDVTLDQIRALQHPNPANPDDSVTLSADNLVTLTATAHDFDGDTDTATLNIGTNLNFEDDGPSISTSGSEPNLIVDETDLATNASASVAGAFTSAFGADGAGTVAYALGITGGNGTASGLTDVATGLSIVLVNNAGVIEGHVGNAAGALAFTVSIDGAGTVTLDQIRAVTHPNTANPDDSVTLANDNLVTVTATVTDKDGDTASAVLNFGQNLNFEDDGPSINANGTQPNLIVDETVLATNASASFASVFTPTFGADGPLDADHNGIADAGAVTYALGITGGNGTNSGLVDTATHEAILLVNNGGVIEGRTATTNQLVFTVTVNSSGQVTLDQIRAIVHPNTANPDDSVTLSADNLITLTATATDGDGDQASAVANIGQNLVFEDDGPHANNDTDVTNPVTDTAVGNVVTGVGTTEGAGNADAPGADGFGSISGLVGFGGSSDNNPAGGFTVNGQFGTLQMDANGNYTYTRTSGGGGVVDTFTYTYVDGDGDPATATLTITVADETPVAGSVNVGLDDDALAGGNPGGTGDDPNSVNATGNLPGSGGDAPLTFGVLLSGAPAGFTYVSGGPGVVLVQQGGVTVLTVTVNSTTGAYSVVQNNPIDHAAGGDENNQNFTITYTVTDLDSDVANGTINISVDDDTPTVSANAAVQLDDDALAGGNAGGTGDDPNATNVSGTLAHSYGADGAGSVAYLTTGAPAGFSYALQGNGDLWVMQGATHVLTLTVNATTGAYTVSQVAPIDHAAGGDENNQSFTINYRVTDGDGDTVDGSISVNVDDDTPTVSANAAVQLDDDALAGGNAGGTGDDANATNVSGTLAHSYGADGAGSMAYLTTGAPAGFSYALQGNGDLWVMQGATHVLTLTINSTTGAYTVTQVAPIDHPAGLDENNVSFTISYNVTDHDGDSATGSIVINVDDDTPTVSANAAVQLDDDALAGGNPGGTGDVNPDTANTSGTLAHSYGADGAGSMAYLTTGAPAGFSYALQGNGDLWVMQGATHVITLTINSTTGAYTVTQVAPIDHAAGNNENDQAFTISYSVTDHDGDSTTGTLTINVDDDTPTVSANAAVQLDDDALAGGNAGGTGDDPNATNVSGTLAHSYGADGAGSTAYLTTGAPAGFSYALQGNGDLWVMQGADHVLTLTVNATTGAYTVTQVAPIDHPAGLDENNVSFTINYRVTDHDGDTVDGSIVVNVDDDTPTAAIGTTGQGVIVDESAGNQVDSNDTSNAGVIALFAGVSNAGTDPNMVAQYAQNASAIVNSTGSSVGADTPGTTAFSLNVSAAGVDSGLNTTSGQDILLFKEGNLIVGRVSGGADDGKAAFAIAIDPSTGVVSMVEYLSINHPNATNPDDSVSIANGAVLAVATVTDADGDSASQSTPIGSLLSFQDSGPIMTAAQNINIQNSGDVAHTGAFAFNLGADGANTATNDVITNVTGNATVGGVAVQNWTLTPGAENATTASYSFSFDYGIGGGNTAHETGTLVFDKVAGTYTVDLDNPIQGVTTILQTAQGTLFQGYEFGTSTLDGSQPAISVTQIQDLAGTANDIYVQFTSVAEPSSGTGDNNLELSNWVPGTDNPAPVPSGGDTAWNAGDLFNQTDSWVSTSNSANGVAGDTIQGGEVLDFTLVQGANPTGVLASPATYAQASAMFLKFDGIGSAEDMIVVLKLYDPNTNTYTTRAVMIENSDIIKGPGAGPGQYSGVSLDNNDGLVIIESNDYNLPGENWVIVGAQVAGSDEGITGTAINLNGAIGAAGDSITGGAFDTQNFQTDTNDGPFKISSIGFLTTQTTPQNAQLDFNVTVTDGDGDSITQAISATVTAAADSTSAATIPAANTTVAPVVLDLNGDGPQFLATDAGVHYDYGSGPVATAWADPNDGILVNDANHNGTVDGASEFVFGSGGVTDLQALAAYDTNGDGQLSAGDANFGSFAVWQDANSNGVADAGEVQSLGARGITSISLSSDGIAYSAAGGDVAVAGTGSYTKADGSTGSLADAAFLTGARAADDQARVSSSANMSVLMGAVAAAGLASQAAAAATTHASLVATTALTGVHNQSLTPIALDQSSAFDMHTSALLSPQIDVRGMMELQSSIFHAPSYGETPLTLAGNTHALPTQSPVEFLQGTQGPAHDQVLSAIPLSANVVMPSAQQLAGLSEGGVAGAQHNQVVAQVLADALHGGGTHGATLDALINALPNHGGGANDALASLATHSGGAVSFGDMGAFAGFSAAHMGLSMEHAVMVHQDAAPLHA